MKWFWLIAGALVAAGSAGAQTLDLPRPAALEPDVQFWVRVYTEIDTRSGFVHDSRDLGVVYRTIRFREGVSRRGRTRQLNQAYQEIRDTLAVLAEGKRDELSAEEQRVLSLWPEDVANSELRESSGRLRFQLGQSDRFRAGLIRSGSWRAHIDGVLAERGLPPELAALPHVESSFDPTAYSKVGAAGMWQFTRSTGLRYMRIDHIVDERRDPFISTIAAARLMENNYDVLESWPLAITAYNHGQAGMRRAVRQLGTDSIESILRNYEGRTFGFASRNFYVAFLAAVQVDANYEQYFGPLDVNQAVDTALIEAPDYLTVATLQSALQTDRGVLRSWNPALTEAVWSGDKFVPRGFELRLPATMLADSASRLVAIPDTQRYAAQMPDIIHRVRSGDTVSGIADRYRVSITSLVQLNGLRSRNFIRAGQILRLPGNDGTVPMTLAQLNGEPLEEPVAEAMLARVEQSAERIPEPPVLVRKSGDPLIEDAALAVVVDSPESAEEAEYFPDENVLASVQADMAADPSDYLVSADGTIEVQAQETLGHYADWLGIRTQRLRDINGMPFSQAVVIGRRLELNFSVVDRATFEQRRIEYQRQTQEAFFLAYQITDTREHVVRTGESLFILALRTYRVPVWLVRQFNPDLDLDRVAPGTIVKFPELQAISRQLL